MQVKPPTAAPPRWLARPLTAVGLIAIVLLLVPGVVEASSNQPIAATAAFAPQLPPPGTHLVFNGTFSGPRLNPNVWATCYPLTPAGAGCSHISGNPELEWYLPSADQVSGGVLHLVASPVPVVGTSKTGQTETYPCSSGMITSFPSFHFTYGYVQMVAKMPNSKDLNLWPAFWMLPSDPMKFLPEIDIIELVGSRTHGLPVVFHASNGTIDTRYLPTASFSNGWHTFAIDWERDSIVWYVDGKAVFEVTRNIPDTPMYLLANLAITSDYQPFVAARSCSGSFDIRSIRVWQHRSVAP